MKLGLPLKNLTLKRYPSGSIFQGFGENVVDYIKLKPSYNGHPGIDLPTFEGDPCLAVCDGIIRDVQDDPYQLGGRGLRLISHEVEETSGERIMAGYAHLKKIIVVNGQRVNKGEVIGYEGNSGFIISGGVKYWGNAPAGKGVHLHFGIAKVKVLGETPNIMNSDNGFQGWVDPMPFYTDSIKPEIPDPRISLMQKLVELYRALIRLKGQEPVA